jgi:hypothetical protein
MANPNGNPDNLKKGHPRGVSASKTLMKTNLAIAVRSQVPAEVLVEFHLAILQGQNPRLVKDGRYEHGWKLEDVCGPDGAGGQPPTLQDKKDAAKALMERGWGMPAQTIHLEQDVKAQIEMLGATLPANAMASVPTSRLLALRNALRPPIEALSRPVEAQIEAPAALAPAAEPETSVE